jgi:hypothetical protein
VRREKTPVYSGIEARPGTGLLHPVFGEERGQLLLVDLPLLAYRMVRFLHCGSPFTVWQLDSFRIRLNRRSTFNYGLDIANI